MISPADLTVFLLESAALRTASALGEGPKPPEVAGNAVVSGTKMRIKMAAAVALSKLGDPVAVDWALGHAAVNSRYAEADLGSIVSHHARANSGPRHQASETCSLIQETGAWSALAGTDDQATRTDLTGVTPASRTVRVWGS